MGLSHRLIFPLYITHTHTYTRKYMLLYLLALYIYYLLESYIIYDIIFINKYTITFSKSESWLSMVTSTYNHRSPRKAEVEELQV